MKDKPLNHVTIRPVQAQDALDLYQTITHPAVSQMLVRLPSAELSETEEWVKKPSPGQQRLVAVVNGKAIGSVSLVQSQNARLAHSGRLGIYVHPDYWGHGIGAALMAAAIDLADNWLNLWRIELTVFTHNTAAIRLYQKFGFEVEGTRKASTFGNGRFLDDHFMARLHNPPAPRPNTPIPPRPAAPQPPASAIIRPLRPNDTEGIHALWTNHQVDRTTLQLPSMELTAASERVSTLRKGSYRMVAEADGRVIGMVGLHQNTIPREAHAAGLGMMVHPDYWGRQVGSQLMAAILDLADNWLNLKRVELDVNTDNPAAVRLYEKFGFALEGTHKYHAYGDGRWADSYFMGRVRDL